MVSSVISSKREEFVELWGRTVVPAVCKTDGQNFKSEKAETKIVHQNKLFSCANNGVSETEGNPQK